MKTLFQILTFSLAFLLLSCGGEVSTSSNTTAETSVETDTTVSNRSVPSSADENTVVRANHNCEVAGEVLDGNQLWIRDKEVLATIVADSATLDPDMGESHRILEIYDTKTCQKIDRHILPVNFSPDYPYYLAQMNYNNAHQIVGVRGLSAVFVYDVENKKLLPELTPEYKAERFGEDAQSGMIQRLEVWEKYLIGYAQDYGAFVFDISDSNDPKAMMPFAEVRKSDESYASLFLLPSADGGVQLIVPSYDATEGEFSINPLLDSPSQMNTNVPASARNNRFLVLRESNDARTPVAIDLLEHKRVDLPADIAAKNTQEILAWMRTQ